MRLKKICISCIVSIVLLLSLFITSPVSATTIKTAYVDVSGNLNVRSGAKNSSKKIGVLGNKTKVSVYVVKNGFAQIKYQNKKAYVSNEYLRYYKNMSRAEAKKILNKPLKMQHKIVWSGIYRYVDIENIMKEGFTKSYIKKFVKYDMERHRHDLYLLIATDVPYYYMFDLSWKKTQDTPELPKVEYFLKNGKEYLHLSQYNKSDTIESPHMDKVYMVKSSKKSSWKVYNYK